MLRRLLRRLRRDEGAATLEAVVLLPLLIIACIGVMVAGRIWYMNTLVESAANAAARAATLTPSGGDASQVAYDAAIASIQASGIDCSSVSINVDTSDMDRPLGELGTVSVDVACTLDNSSFTGIGFAPTFTVHATGISPVDPYSVS